MSKAIENLEHFRDCKKCGTENSRGKLEPGAGPHWGKWTCYKCLAFVFLPKPADDPKKFKRPASHKNLVEKYSKGYCLCCLRPEVEIRLRGNETMEAHHVLPYAFNGSEEESNIWILCTACHKQIEYLRRYVNNWDKIEVFVKQIIDRNNPNREDGRD